MVFDDYFEDNKALATKTRWDLSQNITKTTMMTTQNPAPKQETHRFTMSFVNHPSQELIKTQYNHQPDLMKTVEIKKKNF